MSVDNRCDIVFLGDVAQKFINENRRLRVEARVWLIAEKIFRIKRNGTRNSHTLLHSATYLRGILVVGTLQVHALNAEPGTLKLLFRLHIGEHLQRENHVAKHRFRVKQCRALKQHTYLLAYLLALTHVHLHDVAAVVEYFTLFGRNESHNAFHKHCLSRATLSDDEIGLAIVECGTYIVQNLLVVERLVYMLNFNHSLYSIAASSW